MKYLPKTKLGATVSALYLLIVFSLILIIGTNETGGHGNPLVLVIGLVFVLTLPLSIAFILIWDGLLAQPANTNLETVTMLVVFAVSAVFNAAVIYLVVGFVSQALRSLFTKRLK